ncbi:hypothetical protein O0L34_g13969 [Tuta absoluta]|nr:hypothetical protein O0L34_g13969 [Tuta absoluta]
MKLFLFVLLVSASVEYIYGMTRPQLINTMTIMKKQCVKNLGVSEDKIAKISEGDFREDPEVKCYVACVYKTIQVTKNDKLNKDMVNKQVDILYPPEMKADTKKHIEECLPIQNNYKDFCDRVFYAAKCLYEKNPPNFIFP